MTPAAQAARARLHQRILNLPAARRLLGPEDSRASGAPGTSRTLSGAICNHGPVDAPRRPGPVSLSGRGANPSQRCCTPGTSRNLVRVFFLRERLRRLASKTTGIRHVHVAGAGLMGGDIAAWCALHGFTVTLHDRSADLVEPALQRAARLFERRLKAPGAAAEARRRLVADADGVARGQSGHRSNRRAVWTPNRTCLAILNGRCVPTRCWLPILQAFPWTDSPRYWCTAAGFLGCTFSTPSQDCPWWKSFAASRRTNRA